MKDMGKLQQERILEILNDALERSEEVWKNKEESHAYIIGYLQGAIKMAIKDLK